MKTVFYGLVFFFFSCFQISGKKTSTQNYSYLLVFTLAYKGKYYRENFFVVFFKISLTGIITLCLCACVQLFVLLSLRVD